MSTFSKEWWIKFFLEAGIPAFASTKYAAIFFENRIQSNMLMDLDKDILKEMGITVIGDIIAILKHAKDVYREGFYGNSGNEVSTQKNSSSINNETAPPKKKIVANKIKKIVVRKVKVSSESEVEEELPVSKIIKKKVLPQQTQHNTKIITRKIITKPKTIVKTKAGVIESDDDNCVPTSEIKTKSSVFDRLGVGDVSSTTPNIDSGVNSDSKKTSVFQRLGKKHNNEHTVVQMKRSLPSDAHYGPIIPSEESSAFTKRIRNEVLNSNSSKSVFERIGASCDIEKKSPGLVSKSALLRNVNNHDAGQPIHVNPKVLNVKKLSLLNRSHFRSSDLGSDKYGL
ncbi:uncharacterized protein C19orf47 homolog [Daktulosphaira vitifoliae]|uniref:uncharacterized protein C19orf47 homolog n=1 Tax=Daktulosphaira vitifoliae TaxID=58002 RepID=UPI0021AA056F|nr:uncharacterized protein C19orf47 homolog [Daktulosphaira vitifoliae]